MKQNDQVKDDEMGRTCSTNGRKIIIGWILVGKPERKNYYEDQDVRGVTILNWTLQEIGWDGVDWIELALDRDQWRALVNTVMNLRVP
jgi:hypothetical protein